jgi:hypothetical protein
MRYVRPNMLMILRLLEDTNAMKNELRMTKSKLEAIIDK